LALTSGRHAGIQRARVVVIAQIGVVHNEARAINTRVIGAEIVVATHHRGEHAREIGCALANQTLGLAHAIAIDSALLRARHQVAQRAEIGRLTVAHASPRVARASRSTALAACRRSAWHTLRWGRGRFLSRRLDKRSARPSDSRSARRSASQ
jgi:hypothetical protein